MSTGYVRRSPLRWNVRLMPSTSEPVFAKEELGVGVESPPPAAGPRPDKAGERLDIRVDRRRPDRAHAAFLLRPRPGDSALFLRPRPGDSALFLRPRPGDSAFARASPTVTRTSAASSRPSDATPSSVSTVMGPSSGARSLTNNVAPGRIPIWSRYGSTIS